MAYALHDDIKKRAEERLRGLEYLELCNPGTCLSAAGKTLVCVQDKATKRLLWLEVSDAEIK